MVVPLAVVQGRPYVSGGAGGSGLGRERSTDCNFERGGPEVLSPIQMIPFAKNVKSLQGMLQTPWCEGRRLLLKIRVKSSGDEE